MLTRLVRGSHFGYLTLSLSDSPVSGEHYSYGHTNGGSDGFRRNYIQDDFLLSKINLFIITNTQLGSSTWTWRYNQSDTTAIITVGTLDTGLFQAIDVNISNVFTGGDLDYFNARMDLFDANSFVIRSFGLKWVRA